MTVTTSKAEKAPGESRRKRKKREWLLRQAVPGRQTDTSCKKETSGTKPTDNQFSWADLPDLILEQIFQYLPYKVSDVAMILWKYACYDKKLKQ